jgi:Na+/phosphate symporter
MVSKFISVDNLLIGITFLILGMIFMSFILTIINIKNYKSVYNECSHSEFSIVTLNLSITSLVIMSLMACFVLLESMFDGTIDLVMIVALIIPIILFSLFVVMNYHIKKGADHLL